MQTDLSGVQELFHKYSGTEKLEKTRKGSRTSVEYIIADEVVGVAVSKKGKMETNEFKIYHSNDRTHISPVKKGGIT